MAVRKFALERTAPRSVRELVNRPQHFDLPPHCRTLILGADGEIALILHRFQVTVNVLHGDTSVLSCHLGGEDRSLKCVSKNPRLRTSRPRPDDRAPPLYDLVDIGDQFLPIWDRMKCRHGEALNDRCHIAFTV